MDLNSIKLSAHLIEELYGNQLIKLDPPGSSDNIPEIITAPARGWNSLGNNQKHILIIVKNPGISSLPDQELKFLTAILNGCKLSLNDVAVVNIGHYENVDHKELVSFFKSRIVLLFNVEPSSFGLPMNFPHYQIQPFAGNSFLYAPSLNTLENNIEEKKKFWSSLKRLFNL